MSFIKSFRNIFSGKDESSSVEESSSDIENSSNIDSTEIDNENPFSQPEPPAMRRVKRVQAVSDDLFPPDNPSSGMLIKFNEY